MVGDMTEDQIKQMAETLCAEAFKHYDKNEDGKLQKKESEKMMKIYAKWMRQHLINATEGKKGVASESEIRKLLTSEADKD